MQAYRIEYRDWAYGEWFAASASPVDVYATSAREAEQKAQEKFGSLGKSYRATAAPMPEAGAARRPK